MSYGANGEIGMTRLRIYPASAVTVDNTGWLSGDPCDWFGVTCDAGHVKDLHLRGNNLNGKPPSGTDPDGNVDGFGSEYMPTSRRTSTRTGTGTSTTICIRHQYTTATAAVSRSCLATI